jgi:hypothetical protein
VSQNEIDYGKLIENLERLVREGRHQETLLIIQDLKPKHIPRQHIFNIGKITRRAGNAMLSLKMLAPIFRSFLPLVTPLTDSEKVIYATSLSAVGLHREARSIFSAVDATKFPECHLFNAFTFFGEWKYDEATPLLKKYLESGQISEYMKIVGKINLVAVQIATTIYENLDGLIQEITEFTKRNNFNLLYGNILELTAQKFLNEGDFQKAVMASEEACNALGTSDGKYLFFAKKWSYISKLMLNPQDESNIAELRAFRKIALQNGHWEILRDCDLFEALATGNTRLLHYVVGGTPYEAFKTRAELVCSSPIAIANSLYRQFPENTRLYTLQELSDVTRARIIDIYDFSNEEVKDLAANISIWELFNLLNCDFYKPISITQIFSELFPNEYFNPNNSEKRVANCVYRLRSWLKRNRWPFVITNKKNEFFLRYQEKPLKFAQPKVYLCIHRYKQTIDECYLRSFEKFKSDRSFTAADLANFFRVSKWYALKLIKFANQRQWIATFGKGRNMSYRLKLNPFEKPSSKCVLKKSISGQDSSARIRTHRKVA